MRIFIVDDDSVARAELARLVTANPASELSGEGPASDEMIARIAEEAPDVLLLAAELRGQSGFDFLAKLQGAAPSVIFTAVCESHAVRAFRVNAVDYLLRPVEPELLADALAKVQQALGRPGPGSAATGVLRLQDRVFVRDGARCWFVPVAGIRLLESEGNYTRLHIGGDKPLVYGALKSFQSRLDPAAFFRANRTQIVNLSNIERVSLGENEELIAYLDDGCEVGMSRRMAQQFREQLGL